MAFKFEKLEVWHEAVELSGLVNDLSEKFPAKELYVLSAQIKRAADSVALNIAEGSTGQTTLEFKKFLNYAIRSAIEVVSCLFVAKRRGIVSQDDFENIYQFADALVIRIQSLRNKIR